jgi:hypothetical protein
LNLKASEKIKQKIAQEKKDAIRSIDGHSFTEYRNYFLEKYKENFGIDYVYGTQAAMNTQKITSLMRMVTFENYKKCVDNAFQDEFWKDKITIEIFHSKINNFLPKNPVKVEKKLTPDELEEKWFGKKEASNGS